MLVRRICDALGVDVVEGSDCDALMREGVRDRGFRFADEAGFTGEADRRWYMGLADRLEAGFAGEGSSRRGSSEEDVARVSVWSEASGGRRIGWRTRLGRTLWGGEMPV